MDYKDDNIAVIQLIGQAQLGDQQSMNDLAQLAEGRLFAYIYRLTLNYDLAQDLLQETLLKMVESLKNLRRIDRFWPWLFRIAMGQVQHYFRDRGKKHMVQISDFSKEYLSEHSSQNRNDGLDSLIRRELSDAVFQAMTNLKLAYRNVLVLRCFEQMSYAEIADQMDCKELRARVLFFRAKHSLKKQLSHQGFGKELLLVALGIFGLMTAPAKAASSAGAVSAASLDVGFLAALAGAAGTKLGITIMSAIAAITFTLSLENCIFWFVLLCYISVCLAVVIYTQL
ncbi:MAG: RNA polymerase sigma factor [Phycisphaerae bacterium]|nr:RNA polymerase sigma factor [Phycisphaerae bacterium]